MQSSTSLSERFNGMFDLLLAGASRFLELPIFTLIGFVAILSLAAYWVVKRFGKSTNRKLLTRLIIAEATLVVVAVVVLVDRKIAGLQNALSELQQKTSAETTALLGAMAKLEAKRREFLFDAGKVQAALAQRFAEASLRPIIGDEATDIVQVHINRPLVHAYLAIVDLRNPSVEIKLGVSLDRKKLTSTFARENDCSVAINGEAGNSPGLNSGLGAWRGNLVRDGQSILQESPRFPTPFLWFDRKNRGHFVAATCPERAVATDARVAIWGRWDALVDGELTKAGHGNRQPRTCMAINQEGTFLYLLVADGRQPNYSAGFTRQDAAYCLRAFGAHSGMLCDEGGSSCIYLKQFGGIANIPADNRGQERPTYTHFGICFKAHRSEPGAEN
ncbi:MAG: phosphodiester glycosidase family protein [Verrucomicrobiota bacterium]